MPVPPLKAEISAPFPAPSNAAMRVGMGKFWDYVTGLLGATGNAAEARTALGATATGSAVFTAASAGAARTAIGAADDATAVKTTGNQTIAGTKTFSSPITAVNAAKAWVNFNGTGTPAIRAAHNVSSITDLGIGNYTVNFSTSLASADYAVVSSFDSDADTVNNFSVVATSRSLYIQESLKTTAGFRVLTGSNGSGSSTPLDFRAINLAVFL